jgi:bilirubin oxidase
MKRIFFLLATIVGDMVAVSAQNQMPVPPLVSGPSIDLHYQNATVQFFPGIETATLGYNGAFLGPTIELVKGEEIQLNVFNESDDTTSVHWHGLHVAANDDGGPHQPILPGESWTAEFMVMDDAATYLYHPHTHMKTGKQFTLGAAGFIIVRDEEEAALDIPHTYGVDDFPVVIQTKTFNEQKQLEWLMENTADNEVLTNGVLNAYVELPAQVVRLRLLNGSNEKNINLGFDNGMNCFQIAGDNSLLNNKVELSRVMLSVAERAEVLVNLTALEGEVFHLISYGSEIPLGVSGGPMPMGMVMLPSILDEVDYQVLEIHVVAPTENPITTIPPNPINDLVPYSVNDVDQIREILMTGGMMGQPFTFDGVEFDMDVINYEIPLGHIEKWNLSNMSMMAHPFHLHGTHFYVVSRDDAPPPANETGKKDVVLVYPMENVEVIAHFTDFPDPDMPYMYHCHILHHEDHGMMGQYVLVDTTSSVESEESNIYSAFPNPVAAGEILKFNSINPGVGATVSMYDAGGRLIERQEVVQWPMEMRAPATSGMIEVVFVAGNSVSRMKIFCVD